MDENSSQVCEEATGARGEKEAFEKPAAGDEVKDAIRTSESISKRAQAKRKEAGHTAPAYAPYSWIVKSALFVVYIPPG